MVSKPNFYTTHNTSDSYFFVDENAILVEFKPKWLSQSPSAPKNAIRCRQCAKELHSYVMEPDLKNPLPIFAKPCPLTLGRDEGKRIQHESALRLLPRSDLPGDTQHLHATLTALRDEAAFKLLRAVQEENDKVGPLKASITDEKFALAMTLKPDKIYCVILKFR